MQSGLELLCGTDATSESAREAFRLANKAMFAQQKYSIREPRQTVFRSGKLTFETPFTENETLADSGVHFRSDFC